MPDDAHGPPRATNGHRTNGSVRPAPTFAQRLPDADDAAAPIDLVAVQADDELVTALGARPAVTSTGASVDGSTRNDAGDLWHDGGDPPVGGTGSGADDRLVAMLAAWRAEIDAEPIPELVDLDAAVAAVTAGIAQHSSAAQRRRAGRLRQLAPLAAAAAIIVATVTGVGVGSQDAMPGDTLWAVQKVVNPERAESVEAKVKVESRLETVRYALQKGDTDTAAKELDAIRTELPAVRGQEGKPQLLQEQEFLAAKLADTPPGHPVDLSTPPKSNPAAHPTGSPSSSAADQSATEPSASKTATGSKSTEPDPRKSASDRSKELVAPDRTAPAPERSAPDVTSLPEVPHPDPKPDPTKDGKSEGKPDPTAAPGPVDAPPASSGTDPGSGPAGGGDAAGSGGGTAGGGGASSGDSGTSSDTTAAAGSAGADLHTTATDTTS